MDEPHAHPTQLRRTHPHPPAGLLEELTRELHARGARMTGPRAVVLTVLADEPGHLAAEAVCERVAALDPTVHPSSVHRTLDLLGELGLVQAVRLGTGGRVHHLVRHARHSHGQCRGCGRVVDLPAGLLDEVTRRAAGAGFVLDDQELALTGWCADCHPHPGRSTNSH